MPYNDAVKQRKYQRKWQRARRKRAIDMLGGVCNRCSYKWKLEFHHRNPEEKEDHRIWSWSWKRILVEIAKCDLLCTKCHAKETMVQASQQARTMPRAENGAFMTASA